jgi:hypothetical protein
MAFEYQVEGLIDDVLELLEDGGFFISNTFEITQSEKRMSSCILTTVAREKGKLYFD